MTECAHNVRNVAKIGSTNTPLGRVEISSTLERAPDGEQCRAACVGLTDAESGRLISHHESGWLMVFTPTVDEFVPEIRDIDLMLRRDERSES